MSNIIYLGDNALGSTAAQRADAIKRLGHDVQVHNPLNLFKQLRSPWWGPIHYRTGYRFLNSQVVKWVQEVIDTSRRPDAIWINGGEVFGPESLKVMKKASCPIILYNNDDPTGGRDKGRFDSLLKSLPYYDLCAVMREINVSEFQAKGAKNVLRVYMSYDEEAHKPYAQEADIPDAFRSDVVFIGTWMRYEKRDEFILELIRQGIPVSIWGNRWNKSPHFSKLKSHWRGNGLKGRDYVAAIQGSKVCIGMLSKGNRDMHTQRSLEVPFAGGLFCAERTIEHQEMYHEGSEAVFWSDAEECAEVCSRLLSDKLLRQKIREAGMRRVRQLKLGNEDVCNKILLTALSMNSTPDRSVNVT